ncbi:MAG: hypothetical protein C0603_05240 [Denitrovibrio sp.]|nr:MAG: hypothetical protein C0603_05240 [Denitrovibrio sp.]
MSTLVAGRYFYCFFVLNFLITFAFAINDSLFSLYYKGIGVNGVLLGIAFSLYSFSKIVMTPFTGKLLDRIGAFKILFIGVLLYLIVAIMLLYVHNKQLIILIRVSQGFACAFFRPVIFYIIGKTTESSFRGKVLGTFDLSFYAAIASAPLVGGILKNLYGFGFIFKIIIFCCVLSLILVLLSYPAITSKVFTSESNEKILNNKQSILLNGLYVYIFFRSWGITCMVILLPLYLSDIGYSESHIGLLLSLSTTVMLFSLPFTGRFADTFRKDNLIIIGGVATSFCLILVPHMNEFYYLVFIISICGFFSAMSQPACSSLLIDIASGEAMGTIIGRFNFVMGLGAAVGAFFSSVTYSYFGMTVAFALAGCLGVLASFTFASLTERYFSKVSYQ